jgi:hypothetical protein
MGNSNELEERIQRIEKEIHHINRLDETTFELTEKLRRTNRLIKKI